MRRKIVIFALSSLTLVLLLAGCGGGSGSIDKAAFIEQAGEICEEVSGRLSAEASALGAKEAKNQGSSPEKTGVKVVSDLAVPAFKTELEEIQDLGVPAESKQQIEAFLAAIQKMIKTAETDPAKFISDSGPYESVQLAGRQFGLAACPIAPPSTS